MIDRRPLALALVACTPAPPAGTDSDTTGTTTIVTSSPLPDESSLSPTTSAAASGDPPVKFDVVEVKLDAPIHGLVGCALDAPPGTALAGPSDFGPFTADRAYFGIRVHPSGLTPILLFVAPGADPAEEVAVEYGDSLGETGLVMRGELDLRTADVSDWPGTWLGRLPVYSDGAYSSLEEEHTVVLSEYLGDWDAFDPADPPRIRGTVEGTVDGSFDAVFCDEIGPVHFGGD